MGFPSWTYGLVTVTLSRGASLPLAPDEPIPLQQVTEGSDRSLQVVDLATTTLYRYERTYEDLPASDFIDFVALYEGPALANFIGNPVVWEDEAGVSRTVRLIGVSKRRRTNGNYDLTVRMRLEV